MIYKIFLILLLSTNTAFAQSTIQDYNSLKAENDSLKYELLVRDKIILTLKDIMLDYVYEIDSLHTQLSLSESKNETYISLLKDETQQQLLREYTKIVDHADSLYYKKNYLDARKYYERALTLKPDDEYVVNQLTLIPMKKEE